MVTLLVETVKSACRDDYDQAQLNVWVSSARKQEHWERFLNEQFSLVAEVGGKIVGFGSLENGDFIYFMYVHKDYLGLGVASRIYTALQDEVLRLGCTQIKANVSKTALPFFRRKGFEIEKENRNILDGVTIINYRMVNELSLEIV